MGERVLDGGKGGIFIGAAAGLDIQVCNFYKTSENIIGKDF